MKPLFKILSAAILATTFISCSKSTETGISLAIEGTTSNTSGALAVTRSALAATPGFVFSEALLGVRDIAIKSDDENFGDSLEFEGEHMGHGHKGKGHPKTFDYEGIYLVDLLAGTSTPELGFTNTVPGSYDKFEAESAPAIDSSKTMSLKGTYTDSLAVEHKFDFSTIHRWEYKFKTDTAVVIDEGKVIEMLVSIDLTKLFRGVDFSKLTLNTDNVAIINENNNVSAFRKITFNLHVIDGMRRGHHRHH